MNQGHGIFPMFWKVSSFEEMSGCDVKHNLMMFYIYFVCIDKHQHKTDYSKHGTWQLGELCIDLFIITTGTQGQCQRPMLETKSIRCLCISSPALHCVNIHTFIFNMHIDNLSDCDCRVRRYFDRVVKPKSMFQSHSPNSPSTLHWLSHMYVDNTHPMLV